MDKAQLQTLTNQALDAFWEVISNHFPKATTGDLSPLTSIQFDTAANNAVAEWVMNNVPQ